jgi:hypothetical protein
VLDLIFELEAEGAMFREAVEYVVAYYLLMGDD